MKVSSVTFAVGWWFRPGYSSAQDQWNWHFIITISPPIDMTLAGKKARRKEDAQSDQTNKYTNIIYTMTRVKGEIRTRCNHFYMGCRKLFVCFLFHVHFAGRSPVHSSILDLEGHPPPLPRDRQTYRQTDRDRQTDGETGEGVREGNVRIMPLVYVIAAIAYTLGQFGMYSSIVYKTANPLSHSLGRRYSRS